MTSAYRYLQKIDGQSFANCIDHMAKQAELLGVTLSPSVGLSELISNWAVYLAQDSSYNKELVYKCLDMMRATEVEQAYKKASGLHNKLMERTSIMEKLFGSSDNELVKAITNHPFYQQLQQKDTLVDGFAKVQSTYQEYQKVKRNVNAIKSKLGEAAGILNSLQEQDYTVSDLHIPANLTSALDTIASIDVTRKLLEEHPKLYYSPTALGNLANAAALGAALDYKQAILAVDLNLSRWQSIGYFSLLMSAIARNEISTEIMMSAVAAQNAQYKEFGQLMAGVMK